MVRWPTPGPYRRHVRSAQPHAGSLECQTSGNAADPQQLRVGMRVQAGGAPAALSWTSALIAADLPATGANHVSLFAEHDVAVTLEPPPL